MIKQEQHIFTGLQADIDPAKQKAEYLCDAHNIRFTSRGDNTMLAITNEKGPTFVQDQGGNNISINGTYLGHCIINNYIVVFTTWSVTNQDYIYRIEKKDNYMQVTSLYNGTLNFSIEHPIEAIGSFENEFIQKVYWVDGLNQPRVINITKDLIDNKGYTGSNPFDFVQNLQLNESISVTKEISNSGIFPAGCIQYAITYYNKYGQESNIAYTTSLYYTSFPDRGGSPESKCSNAFRINISNADTNFDYVRIYSIFRTSLEGTPTAKRLVDILITEDNISDGISYLDNGTNGENIDPQELLFIGGDNIVASTITAKDGTLFLGNIKVSRSPVSTIPVGQSTVKSMLNNYSFANSDGTRTVYLPVLGNYTYYYQPTLNGRITSDTNSASINALGFKSKEYYRFGVQFQHKSGKWSEPIWLNDSQIGNTPQMNTSDSVTIPTKHITIPSDIITAITNAGYKRARGLVVCPSLQDRTILAQGMLCPTVYSLSNRDQGVPYAQSSWFLRPSSPRPESVDFRTITNTTNGVSYTVSENIRNRNNILAGAIPEARHLHTLQSFKDRGAEIQGIPFEFCGRIDSNIGSNTYINEGKDTGGNYTYSGISRNDLTSVFAVDQSIVTMHSPEIEFDDSLASLDFNGSHFRVVGAIDFIANIGDISIETSTPTIGANASGFIKKTMTSLGSESDRSLISGLFYGDYLTDDVGTTNAFAAYNKEKYEFRYMIYPWQKSGSLNNDTVRGTGNGTRTAVLDKKKISNIKYSGNTAYYDYGDIPISTPQLFSSDQLSLIKLSNTNIADGKANYYGNIDTFLPAVSQYGAIISTGEGAAGLDWDINSSTNIQFSATFNDIVLWHGTKNGLFYNCHNLDSSSYTGWTDSINTDIGDWSGRLRTFKDGIRMRYKSTAHIVFKLNSTNLAAITPNFIVHPYLYMGELYRPYSADTIFGGKSDDAFKANKWLPAGDPVQLNSGSACTINFSYGDTWYQRYDCLKTYPFSLEDENSIVEIGSFMVETRINIDGRYDRNRGQASNLLMTPEIFNKINPVYSQLDNFFTYRILDKDYYRLNEYPSSIIWSLQKTSGSDIDNWTSITTNSLLDLDGNKGKVSCLIVNNDNIYCFQDYGISNILFNSRVQVNASDGIPIEISNNYKVDGYRYITDNIGCINKWTITVTPSGMYFIDSMSKAFYNLNGTQLGNISSTHGMSNWFNTLDVKTPWSAINKFTGIRCFYDNVHNDIYIVNKLESLCFSELLGQFTSFMSYNEVPSMFNIGSDFYSIYNYSIGLSIYKMFAGDYNTFFGVLKPFDISFISNSESNTNKVFSNVDLRADFYAAHSIYHGGIEYEQDSTLCFDHIKVSSISYDTGSVALNHTNAKPSNIKNKFRSWRITIPRDSISPLKRISDNYATIKLSYDAGNNIEHKAKMVIHDIGVTYYT